MLLVHASAQFPARQGYGSHPELFWGNVSSAYQDPFFQSIYYTADRRVPNFSDTLTGDWGGARQKLYEDGVAIEFSYTNNLLGNFAGGIRQGFVYDDSTGLNLTFNLEKLMQLPGWSFFVAFVQRNGESLSNKYIGNLFSVSQIFGGQNFRMNQLYLNWQSKGGKANLFVGRLNAGDYFLESPFYYSFVNNAIDGNPVGIFFNFPFSAYPNAQWGAYLNLKANDVLTTKFAVFNTNAHVGENQYHGFNFSFHGDDGVQFITEWDLLNNDKLCFLSCNLPGRYTAGFIYVTGNLQKNFLTRTHVRGNYAVYYQLEQKLYQPGSSGLRGITFFFVMELFPEAYNKIPLFYDTGLIFRGLAPKRPLDFLAIGYASGKFSSTLAESERVQGEPGRTFEANLEVSYSMYFKPWFFIQPVVQYVIRPSGYKHIPNAWVYGMQMSVDF